jgi:class 3 adenylate cyclase/ActR/RegA family two-component response regulator
VKYTILCVDDEQIVRDSLKEQLKRAFGSEARIEAVESAEAALELLQELNDLGAPVPVVIVDHIMPGLKGDDLLCEIHKRMPDTLKVLLTGQASGDTVGKLVNHANLYRYVGKPWERADLELTVRGAVGRYFQDRKLEQQNDELREMTESLRHKSETFFRFVPRELLSLLGVDEHYEEVRLGLGVEKFLSILFADIRGFSALCEPLSPSRCVRFVNEYLQCMEKPITENGGFVQSFAGDGVMAMFEGPTDNAVRAGIGMSRGLQRFNEGRRREGLSPVRIGVGINAGETVLGTVGARSRIQCSVVGDPVNMAARCESLTKRYRCTLLVSDRVVSGLTDPSAYTLRQVDRIQVEGRSGPLELVEVVDAEPDHVHEIRRKTLERYRSAIESYYRAEFVEASRLFAECLVMDPNDVNALSYLARCREHAANGVPANWDGVARGGYQVAQ